MRAFSDTSGKSWNVSVNIAAIRRVRDLTGIDLMQIVKGELLDRLANDPVLLVDVLFAVCKPQADEASITLEALSNRIEGDTIDAAGMALVMAIADFLPSQQRKLIGQLVDTGKAIQDKAFKDASTAIQGAMP